MKTACPRCRLIRTVLLACLLGGGAGYALARWGVDVRWSMSATFFGAFVPIFWYFKTQKSDDDER